MIKTLPIKNSGQNKSTNSQKEKFQNLEKFKSKKAQKVILKIRNSTRNSIVNLNSQAQNLQNLNPKKPKVVIIGAGFSGLSSSCYLAKAGFEVLVVEKNSELGGRAQVWEADTSKGKFKFDMGPSWYWMPGVFEDFFGDFEFRVSDFYDLQKLSTQYRMFVSEENSQFLDFKILSNSNSSSANFQSTSQNSDQNLNFKNKQINDKNCQKISSSDNSKTENLLKTDKIQAENAEENWQEKTQEKLQNQENSGLEKSSNSEKNLNWQNFVNLPSEYEEIKELFEKMEAGSGKKLDEFVEHGEYTYDKGVREYMQKPSLSPLEFASFDFASGVLRAGILQSFGQFVRQNFRNQIIRQMLEFPVLFLGATPAKTPKIYTLMAYTCLKEGTFYPTGGMSEIVNGMVKLAKNLGVKFVTDTEIVKIESET